MTINGKEMIKSYDGTDYLDQGNTPLTLRSALALALNNFRNDEIPTAEDKAKIYMLSTKLYSSDQVELTVDDMAFLKERAGKILKPLIYGRISDLFEQKN